MSKQIYASVGTPRVMFITEPTDKVGSVFALGDDNNLRSLSWYGNRLSWNEERGLMNQLERAAIEGRLYEVIQLCFRILSSDHHSHHMLSELSYHLHTAFSNFDRLNRGMQRNDDVALTEAFAVACHRGQLDDVGRLSHVVRDDVHMLGVGLHFALLQPKGSKRKHWDIIRWLMDNTQLRDNPLVLRHALVVACKYKELEKVRWMLQYRELARDTDTIDTALSYAFYRYIALVKCLVEHADVDVNRAGRVGNTLLHDVICMSERLSDLHSLCYDPHGAEEEVYRLVYECGADVNEQNNIGDTPLHAACSSGNQDIVEALMSRGADVNITNDGNQTPAQVASFHNNEELIPLLDRKSLMDTLRSRQLKLLNWETVYQYICQHCLFKV